MHGEPASVLVIDDHESVRFTLSEILTFAGWQVEAAATGWDGLARFRARRHDLVIVDYHMPDGDALTTVRHLRALDPDVPILVLTVEETADVAARFLEAGATDFAVKPVKAPDLISRVRLHLKMRDLVAAQRRRPAEPAGEKGICPTTLEKILAYLRAQAHPVTLAEITQGTALAYPTVHRYVQYLEATGRVAAENDYGKVGRPRKRYRILQP